MNAGKMAVPSPRDLKAPPATSAAKSDEEMVLPGFPDADSFVKVSSRGLGDAVSFQRRARSRPGPSGWPHAEPRAGIEGPLPAPSSLSLHPPGMGPRTRTLKVAPLSSAFILLIEPMQP